MSNLLRIDNLKQIVDKLEPDFNALAQIHGAVSFKREASFAMQILKDNDYLMGIALENQDSLRMAVINVAAVGLTLSPLKALAYLVPRKKRICLDISYRGFVQLAADCGAIKWAKAEIVCQKDIYVFNGVGKEPEHQFTPFADRGNIIGVYCLAKTGNDEFILDHMAIDEVYHLRNRSESWKAHKSKGSDSPWKTDEREMIKKTIIRRAQKMWPMTDHHNRIERAQEVANEAEEIHVGAPIDVNEGDHILGVEKIKNILTVLERKEESFIEHLARGVRRDIKSLDDLTPIEMKQAIVFLEQLLENKKGKK